ncbi:MAG: putative bifunctional diguanylate cyclase/phosphodiesterase [Pseudonocardia sp.]
MTRNDAADDRRAIPGADHLARVWMQAVLHTSYVSMSRADLQAFLTELAAKLLDAFTTERFDRSVPHNVGTAMVTAHFTTATSLERSLMVLGEELGRAVTTPGHSTRLAAVQGALAAGYAQALQDRTRHELERISAAAFTARSAAEQARWASETRFKAVFADAVIGIGISDINGAILEVNRAACELFGYTAQELSERSMFDFIHPEDKPGVWREVKEMMAGSVDHLRMEKAYFRKDGAQIWTDLVLSLIRDPDGEPLYIVGMLEDITERLRLQTRLRHQAQHDPLTGLPNRTLFFERLGTALEAGTAALGVCYLDLDGFKAINDTLGHELGDELLRIVAQRLTTELGPDGHLVARMGGDEFVILVDDLDDGTDGADGADTGRRDELRRVAQRALDTVRHPVVLGNHQIIISASIGVVARGDGGREATELMKAADTTLYWAKNDGRDRYALFDSDRHRTDVNRYELSARMPEALARGEFVLDYQPLVRLTDQRVIGVEALVRWALPTGERLGPSKFIPLAEETGLIVPLGRWVLEQACRQAVQWYEVANGTGEPRTRLLLSVNIAARQVRHPGIVEDVARILEETGWPAHALQLELTETDMMGTTGTPLAALRELKAMGIQIAIDDFGTGYSNLAYLRDLPVHVLKLAGPFTTGRSPGHDGGVDEVDVEVLALLIRLAHTMGLSVTAEFVETAAHFERLRRLGCDIGQGWYFAPAAGPEVIPQLLQGKVPPPPQPG